MELRALHIGEDGFLRPERLGAAVGQHHVANADFVIDARKGGELYLE
jgi:hypothetical protein